MAETVENVNKSEFFQNIVKDYENTPIAEYFKNDVEEILKSAKNGLTLTDEAELNNVYNATMTLVEGLNKKINACLNEIVLNFKGKGGNSNLKGTFYHR